LKQNTLSIRPAAKEYKIPWGHFEGEKRKALITERQLNSNKYFLFSVILETEF
jgi:hypothetical protein